MAVREVVKVNAEKANVATNTNVVKTISVAKVSVVTSLISSKA